MALSTDWETLAFFFSGAREDDKCSASCVFSTDTPFAYFVFRFYHPVWKEGRHPFLTHLFCQITATKQGPKREDQKLTEDTTLLVLVLLLDRIQKRDLDLKELFCNSLSLHASSASSYISFSHVFLGSAHPKQQSSATNKVLACLVLATTMSPALTSLVNWLACSWG